MVVEVLPSEWPWLESRMRLWAVDVTAISQSMVLLSGLLTASC